MKLHEIVRELDLKSLTPQVQGDPSKDVSGGYVSDLLSDVLAHAPTGGVLVTIQVHMNVLAVAVHAGLSAIIFASGRTPDAAVLAKAVEERLPLYVANNSAFDIVGRLYALGIKGPHA